MQKMILWPVVRKCLFLPLVTLISTIGGVTKSLAQSGVNQTKNLLKNLKFLDNVEFTPQAVNFTTNAKIAAEPAAFAAPQTQAVVFARFAPAKSAVAIENVSTIQFKYAIMMDVEVESLSSPQLYNTIDDWYGTRYSYGGTTKRGIDCSAFTRTLLGTSFAFSLPRTAREQYAATDRIQREDLREGDLVFFNTRGGISHVGVYLTNGKFVHASSSKGVMISDLTDGYYNSRYIGGGRVRNESGVTTAAAGGR
jgi:murein DD-endopeptidase / murein LD-carboxypeptidase